MSASVKAVSEPVPFESAEKLCDELAQTLAPANAVERMLLTQVTRSWERLQRAYELERQYFKGRDAAEIIRTKLNEFRAVTRYLSDCERAWRHAVLTLEKTQRRRQREAGRTVTAAPRPPAPPAEISMPPRTPFAAAAPFAKRE